MKRFITVLMSAMIALSMMPTMAFAAECSDGSSCSHEAEIGNDHYATFEAAVKAATDGSTIVLLKDATLEQMLLITKDITIDLNGKTLSASSNVHSWAQVIDGKTIQINGQKEGSTVVGRLNLGIANNNNGNAVINGGTYTVGSGQTVLHINGTCLDSNVSINGATIDSIDDNGIQLNGKGKFSITDSIITGGTGVYIKAGHLTVTNSNIKGTKNPVDYTYNGNGANPTGDAMVIDACNYPGGKPEVVIESGCFSGTKAALGYYQSMGSGSEPGSATISVKGGEYSEFSVLPFLTEDSDVTINLDKDVNLDRTIAINKGITINLNGHNITASDCRAFHITGGDVIITGKGTVASNKVNEFDSDYSVIRVGDNSGSEREARLTIDKDVKVTSNHCYGVTVFGSKTKETVVIDGTVEVTGEAPAISGNGSADYDGTDITVNGTVSATKDNAIYHPQSGTLTINGAVTGLGGIEAKSGIVSIGDKAVITATGSEATHAVNSNGCSSLGYAIAAVKNDAYAGNTKITIKGGQINGPVDVLSDNGSEKTASIEITGGVFSSNPKAYVPTGTNTYHQKTGKYFVGSMPSSTSGYNAWALQNGVYEETYVAPAEPETPDAPVIDNSGSGDNASTNVDASGSTVVTDGKAEVSIDSTTGDKIVENAKENNVADVVIKAETEKGDSTGSTVALPESTVQALAKDTEASVTIKTDSATVTLDKDAVKATAAQAGDSGEVKLEVVTVENTEDTLKVELKLVTSKGTVSDFQGGNVTVTVPVDPELAKKEIVCVYIDDNDKYTMMEGSLSSDGKSYTFTTGHFSTYAILEKAKADEIIADQNKPSDIASAKVTGVVNKTYTGKSITQNPVVTVGESKLVKGTDYTVSYKNNVNAGVATLTIKGAGSYTGTITKTFKINPKGTSISKVTGQKKAVKVVWKKQLTKMKSSYVSGYQVQYSTSSKFTSGTSKYTNAKFSKGRTTKTIKNLKAGKKYYVRVRTYKTEDGTKCYSSWSKAKSVKTK